MILFHIESNIVLPEKFICEQNQAPPDFVHTLPCNTSRIWAVPRSDLQKE